MSTIRLEGIAAAVFGRREAPAEASEGTATTARDATAETPTTGRPPSPWGALDLDTAIRLRWALRDIKAERTKLTPVSPGDLETLIEMSLVGMRDDALLLTISFAFSVCAALRFLRGSSRQRTISVHPRTGACTAVHASPAAPRRWYRCLRFRTSCLV